MKIPLKNAAVTAALAAGLAIGSAAHAVESEDPIKLTIHDWTGQYITTHIMGEVLERMGYNVKYVQADYIAQFAGLESRRPARRHGNLGDHRQAGHGSELGHREDD